MNGVPPSSNPSSRLGSVQALRGVAALMVVIAHALASAAYGSGTSQGAFASLAALGAAGVDLFFIISGFVMALGIDQNPRPAPAFIRDRILRIAPLFWILSGLTFVLLMPELGKDGLSIWLNTVLIIPLFDGMTYHPPLLFVGWTLAFELCFYALVGLTLLPGAAGQDRVKRLMALVLTAGVIGAFWQPGWATARILFNPMMFEFLFGIIVYRMWRSGAWASRAPLLMIGGIFLLTLVMINPLHISLSLNGQAVIENGEGLARSLMLGLPGALVFAGIVLDQAQPARRLFGHLGDASYSIYLTQVLVLGLIEKAIIAGVLHSYAIIAVLVVAGSVASGLLVHWTLERPLLATFKARRDRGNRALPTAAVQ